MRWTNVCLDLSLYKRGAGSVPVEQHPCRNSATENSSKILRMETKLSAREFPGIARPLETEMWIVILSLRRRE
jgi:hypothetical protein